MTTVLARAQRTLHRPVRRVWELLADWKRLSEWAEGIDLDGFGNGNGLVAGVRFRQRIDFGPVSVECDGLVVEARPPTQLALDISHPMLSMRIEYHLQAATPRGRTLIAAEARDPRFSIGSRLMAGRIAEAANAVLVRQLDRLQELTGRES